MEDRIKLFAISQLMIEGEIDQIEKTYHIDLGRHSESASDKDDKYYPQFPEQVRREAREMGLHYELFYCLENSIREIVGDKLAAEHGSAWWENCVPGTVKDNVKKNIKNEREAGVSPRSTKEIDYTNFGELGEIVRSNWDSFSDTFNNQKAFGKVMTNLNQLRVPIAHCSPLADDEVVRLQLAVKDWFRLME